MLPFTTYHIPEAPENQTQPSHKWLFFLHNETITPEKTDLLSKIATALKAEMATHAAIHHIDHPVSFHDLIPSTPSLIISFGVPLASFGINIDLMDAGLRLMEKHAVILTCSLEALEQQAAHKKSLWRDMQLYLSTTTRNV